MPQRLISGSQWFQLERRWWQIDPQCRSENESIDEVWISLAVTSLLQELGALITVLEHDAKVIVGARRLAEAHTLCFGARTESLLQAVQLLAHVVFSISATRDVALHRIGRGLDEAERPAIGSLVQSRGRLLSQPLRSAAVFAAF